ncbi:36797_t:CDS:1, partial [Racocetra persica]
MAPKVFWRAESHTESHTKTRKPYRNFKVIPKLETLTKIESPTE